MLEIKFIYVIIILFYGRNNNYYNNNYNNNNNNNNNNNLGWTFPYKPRFYILLKKICEFY